MCTESEDINISKHYICDKCGKEFPQAIEEEKYKDVHGKWHVFDLCAPCKNSFKTKKDKPSKDYFETIIKKK